MPQVTAWPAVRAVDEDGLLTRTRQVKELTKFASNRQNQCQQFRYCILLLVSISHVRTRQTSQASFFFP
jgi:hypothetical protein